MWKTASWKTEEAAVGVVNLVVGIALALSPGLIGFAAATAAAWNA